jgi:hypothetical protein
MLLDDVADAAKPTLVVLVSWRLWRQRNARCFNNTEKQFSVQGLIDQVVAD